DQPVGVVVRVVAPLDELGLAVRLPTLDGQLQLARPLVDAALQLGDRDAAVEARVSPAEDVQVHPVEHEDPHAINLSSSRRTSSAGTGTSQRGPSSPRRTSRSSPPTTFLSRWSASHARSRSTHAGVGRSTSSTWLMSRPDRRRAASSPSATARP